LPDDERRRKKEDILNTAMPTARFLPSSNYVEWAEKANHFKKLQVDERYPRANVHLNPAANCQGAPQ